MQKKRDTKRRDAILAELQHEVTTPRHPSLKDDQEFLARTYYKIGSLLCQAEECGKQDYEYIVNCLHIPKQQAREIIKGKRMHDYIEENVAPLIAVWLSTIEALKGESHLLEEKGIEEPSEKWSDLADEMCRLAYEIDHKTMIIRMKNKSAFPSYVKQTEELIQGSIQLAYPDQIVGKISIQQFDSNKNRF